MAEENNSALVVTSNEARRQAEIEVAGNFRKATSVAGVCKDIVLKTSVVIANRKYVPAASWEAIATAHGYIVSTRDIEYVKGHRDEQWHGFAGGFRCIGELKNMETGVVIATAEGFVSEDETTWFGGEKSTGEQIKKRSDSAIRAMVQTRAAGRVCKQAFAHVVVLMNAGLSTTPLEEVTDPDNPLPEHGNGNGGEQQDQGEPIYDWRNVRVHFGQKHGPGCDPDHPGGKELGELSEAALKAFQEKWQPKPWNGKFNPKDLRLRRALDISMGKSQPDKKPGEAAGTQGAATGGLVRDDTGPSDADIPA